ncbi:MAG: BMC domain-containing protein [Blautia sp.]|nr:BMC domain-containing protein [Blautia sp.]
MSQQFEGKAIGVFEFDNLVACITALDQATKTSDVVVQGVERNRLKSGACVKIRGSVSDVRAAMDAAIMEGSRYGKLYASTVIASPDASTETAISMTINK